MQVQIYFRSSWLQETCPTFFLAPATSTTTSSFSSKSSARFSASTKSLRGITSLLTCRFFGLSRMSETFQTAELFWLEGFNPEQLRKETISRCFRYFFCFALSSLPRLNKEAIFFLISLRRFSPPIPYSYIVDGVASICSHFPQSGLA